MPLALIVASAHCVTGCRLLKNRRRFTPIPRGCGRARIIKPADRSSAGVRPEGCRCARAGSVCRSAHPAQRKFASADATSSQDCRRRHHRCHRAYEHARVALQRAPHGIQQLSSVTNAVRAPRLSALKAQSRASVLEKGVVKTPATFPGPTSGHIRVECDVGTTAAPQ
jgi:hypothetical protein